MMMCSQIKEKLNLQGGGLSKRSFIYISDVNEAKFKIIEKGKIGKSYHISTKQQISIKKLVQEFCLINKINYENMVNITESRLGHDDSYMLDTDYIRNTLDWRDKISLEEGLEFTFNWVKDNINILRKLPQTYEHKK